MRISLLSGSIPATIFLLLQTSGPYSDSSNLSLSIHLFQFTLCTFILSLFSNSYFFSTCIYCFMHFTFYFNTLILFSHSILLTQYLPLQKCISFTCNIYIICLIQIHSILVQNILDWTAPPPLANLKPVTPLFFLFTVLSQTHLYLLISHPSL